MKEALKKYRFIHVVDLYQCYVEHPDIADYIYDGKYSIFVIANKLDIPDKELYKDRYSTLEFVLLIKALGGDVTLSTPYITKAEWVQYILKYLECAKEHEVIFNTIPKHQLQREYDHWQRLYKRYQRQGVYTYLELLK